MNPKLSVIIPVYNTEKYLENCINSILKQTYKDYEIILVNDGSKDGSDVICDAFAEKYDFISVIHKENSGPIHSRQEGFRISNGEYISYIDSDDSVEPEMYEHMMEKINQYDADIAICGIVRDAGKKSYMQRNLVEDGYYDKERLKSEVYPQMLFNINAGTPGIVPSLCNKIIKRDLLEKNLMEADARILYGEDAICSYPCLLDAERVYIDNSPFYHYRLTKASIISGYDKTLLKKFIVLVDFLDKTFKKHKYNSGLQLPCYTARHTLECIRKELLFNRRTCLSKRISCVKKYVNKPTLKNALNIAYQQKLDLTTRIKMKLIKKNHFFILYLLFYGKNWILFIKECNNGEN